jgi:hypothetical protein
MRSPPESGVGYAGQNLAWSPAAFETTTVSKENAIKLTPPKVITWWIAVIVGVIGILSYLVTIPVLSGFAVWLIIIAFVLLALATAISGL